MGASAGVSDRVLTPHGSACRQHDARGGLHNATEQQRSPCPSRAVSCCTGGHHKGAPDAAVAIHWCRAVQGTYPLPPLTPHLPPPSPSPLAAGLFHAPDQPLAFHSWPGPWLQSADLPDLSCNTQPTPPGISISHSYHKLASQPQPLPALLAVAVAPNTTVQVACILLGLMPELQAMSQTRGMGQKRRRNVPSHPCRNSPQLLPLCPFWTIPLPTRPPPSSCLNFWAPTHHLPRTGAMS